MRRRAQPLAAVSADEVLDTALALADERGWRHVTVHALAERLKSPMSEIFRHYRDLDAVADAWFARVLAAMLTPPADMAHRSFADRLAATLDRWFDAAAAHRRATGEMLQLKLYPSHPHHWVPLIFSLSRIVQWMLDAAQSAAAGRRRQALELAVSAAFLQSIGDWLTDDSTGQEASRTRRHRRLRGIEAALDRLWPPND
jgi:AcrR family transcriptional regulator